MPTSRHRRRGRTRPRRTTSMTRPALPEKLREMRPWIDLILDADAAEARGDAAAALAIIDEHPVGPDGRPWWRPWRERRLRQLAWLGDAAPGWAVSRWVLAQAAQVEVRRAKTARDRAVQVRGGPSTLWGTDPTDAECKITDHDWVFRQLVLHEHGGLADFLRHRASSALLSLADRVDEWVGTSMGGYEIVETQTREIVWLDLSSRALVRTINLGGSQPLAPGEAVLGRIVPSRDGLLFDLPPLWVPHAVADAVAEKPESWTEALAGGCREPDGEILSRIISRVHEFDVLCDLPARMRRELIVPVDGDLRADDLGTGGNGQEYDVGLVLAVLEGSLELDPRCCDTCPPAHALVAAALLEPGTAEALVPLLDRTDLAQLGTLEAELPEPAAEVCRRLAHHVRSAA